MNIHHKRKIYLILLCLLVAFASFTDRAWASVAVNTKVTNSAVLSYFDGTSTQQATSSVTITVTLKAALTITAASNPSGPYPTPLSDDFTLTNNANGPDTFTLTTGTNTLVNTTAVTATPDAPITLGGTVTVSGSTTTNLIVPSDGVSDSSVWGIKALDTIVINGTDVRTVTAITDNASGTSTITVAALSSAPGAGVIIGQRVTVHATVTPNNITAAGTNVTVNVTMTATSQADNTVSAVSGNDANTFYSGSAILIKYVRNVTAANGTGGTTKLWNTFTYYSNPTLLAAKPGDILEYLLLATASATAPVSAITLTDLVPVDFVTLNTSAYGGKAFRYYADESVPATYLDFTPTASDDAVDYNATFDTTVNAKGKITAWLGGAAPAFNTPGSIAMGKSFILLYQVTVKP